MKRFYVSIIFISALCAPSSSSAFKILHLSLHKGCINDFEEVARALSLEVTNYYIHDAADQFDPEANGNDIYNITHERAERIWHVNKEFFAQYDAIITSDTAPLSRIFLQNGWKKPLIIWICNRFDYHNAPAIGEFPDAEYYELFKKAIDMPNVQIISYTPYEHFYANQKGINIGPLTIRPLGCLPKENSNFSSGIPETVSKKDTIFIYPRLSKEQAHFIEHKCSELGIITHHGAYNGPDDLTNFKGILYFPYAWSNLTLFENIQRGIVHFVPSEEFIQNKKENGNFPFFTSHNLHLCDWYCDEYKDLFIYFDSWQDLKEKIKQTGYETMHEKIKKAGHIHWHKNLKLWRAVFQNIVSTNEEA